MHVKSKSFNNIKIHTQYSICEGAIKIDELADYCKNNDVVTAYRNYYIQEKSYFAKWKFVKQPDWFNEGVNNANIRL